jgi:hypothetical protein
MTLQEFKEKYPMVQESDLFSVAFYITDMVEEANEEMYLPVEDEDEQDAYMEEYDSDDSETVENPDTTDEILNSDEFYIIASTSFTVCETFYFPSKDGSTHSYYELGCSMALRWGDWEFANETEIYLRLCNHFPQHFIEKQDTITIDDDGLNLTKRTYKLSKSK